MSDIQAWVIGDRKHGGKSRWIYVLIVPACVAVLLLPVTSITDDGYCDETAMVDETTTSQLVKAARTLKAAAHAPHLPAATLLASAQNPLWQALGLARVEQAPVLFSAPVVLQGQRAPPSSADVHSGITPLGNF